MLAPELKHQVQKLWDKFWAGGIANPLPAIEKGEIQGDRILLEKMSVGKP
jgi:hypothetical protein